MKCVKCGIEKDVESFYKTKRHKSGLTGVCKECCKIESHEHYVNNIDYYRELSKSEKVKEYRRSERGREVQRRYRRNHKDLVRAFKKEYRKTQKHKDQVKKQTKRLRETSLTYRLSALVRGRIHIELKKQGSKKEHKTIKYIGCTIPELIKHLELQFKEGMSWDNYGYDGWHIDHIIPCAHFDLTQESEQKKCFHYTNLQPLWAIDNLRKGARFAA